MQVHGITCSQCGARLAVNPGDTFVVCDHCGTRCVLEYSQAEAASFAPTPFVDQNTGLVAFTARIPQGWHPQAAIQPNNVLDNWITLSGSATSANGYEKLLYESMVTYREVKDDPQQRGSREPIYTAQDQRLYWRYHEAGAYANEIATQVGGPEVELVNRTQLPGKVGSMWLSQETYQTMWQLEQQSLAQANAMAQGGMVWRLNNLLITTALSLYRIPSQAGDRGILIATICKANDMTLTESWGQMLYRGGMGMGGMGMGTTNYIEWKPTYYLLLTEWPVAEGSFEKFSTFVDSLDLDPNVKRVADHYSQQFEAQLAHMVRQNDERWERVSQFARQQSADLDRWRTDNWNRMQEHDQRMAQIRDASFAPSSFGAGESLDDRIQRLRHESMMGVNTYEREDGSTYEFSTQADRAFENDYDPRVHVGTEGYYDDWVPDGWTEGQRKL